MDEITIKAFSALERERPAQARIVAYALAHPGATHRAIAEAFGISRRAVGKALERARRGLEEFRKRSKTQ